MKCLRPVSVIVNGVHRLVPCGKCDACQIVKSNKRVMLVSQECQNNKYNIFTTLTYSNDSVPYVDLANGSVHANGKIFDVSSELPVVQFGEEIKENPRYKFAFTLAGENPVVGYDRPTVDFAYQCYCIEDTPYLQKKDGCIGVLWYYDFQCYIKRLRKCIAKYFVDKYGEIYDKEKTRFSYSVVGEYGPKTARPHWHFVLHTNSKELFDFLMPQISGTFQDFERFARCPLCSCWPLCDWRSRALSVYRQNRFDLSKTLHKVFPSFVSDATSVGCYVASYISLSSCKFGVSKVRIFRPCFHQSKKGANGLFGISNEENENLQKVVNGEFVGDVGRKVNITRRKLTTYFGFSSRLLASVFPRFSRIDEYTDTEKFRLYSYYTYLHQPRYFRYSLRTGKYEDVDKVFVRWAVRVKNLCLRFYGNTSYYAILDLFRFQRRLSSLRNLHIYRNYVTSFIGDFSSYILDCKASLYDAFKRGQDAYDSYICRVALRFGLSTFFDIPFQLSFVDDDIKEYINSYLVKLKVKHTNSFC